MSTAFDTADLEPGGLWRCNTCGGLVEEFGCYLCTTCAFSGPARGAS